MQDERQAARQHVDDRQTSPVARGDIRAAIAVCRPVDEKREQTGAFRRQDRTER